MSIFVLRMLWFVFYWIPSSAILCAIYERFLHKKDNEYVDALVRSRLNFYYKRYEEDQE